MFLSIEQCNAQPAPTLPWPPPLQHHPCPHVPSFRSHLSGMWTNSCTHHFCVKATIKYFNYNYFCPTHFHEWTIVWAAKINCGSLGLCFTRAVVRDCGRGPSCGHQPSPAQHLTRARARKWAGAGRSLGTPEKCIWVSGACAEVVNEFSKNVHNTGHSFCQRIYYLRHYPKQALKLGESTWNLKMVKTFAKIRWQLKW